MQLDTLLENEKDLKCTQKAIDALLSNTILKGRTRQYCLLLNNTDATSLKLRDKLSIKIDLLDLFENNFITFESADDYLDVDNLQIKNRNNSSNDDSSKQLVAQSQPESAPVIQSVSKIKKNNSNQNLKDLESENTVFSGYSARKVIKPQASDNPVSPMLKFAAGSF